MSSLRPVASVESSVSDGFCQVLRLHMLASSQVGDGAGHLEDTAVGSGGEGELFHRHAKHIHACLVWLGKLMNHALAHLGVAVDTLEILVACGLQFPCLDDSLTDVGTRLAWGSLGDVLEWYGSYLALDVDAVEKWTRNLVHVSLYLSWGTYTMVGGVAVIATWARIHACHKHERTRIVGGIFRTADGDMAVFQWLAEHFECGLVEFG